MTTLEISQKNSIAIDSKDSKAIDPKAIEESKADKNKRIEQDAIRLMQALKAEPKWLRFFCKCVYSLPEGTIAFILEGAKRANTPTNYFCASAKREMDKQWN